MRIVNNDRSGEATDIDKFAILQKEMTDSHMTINSDDASISSRTVIGRKTSNNNIKMTDLGVQNETKSDVNRYAITAVEKW